MKQLELQLNQRTYGTFEYREESFATRRGQHQGMWVLDVEPAVAVRLKRVLGRVRSSRTGAIMAADTIEVARDLEWVMERWPLNPVNDASERRLLDGASKHRRRESDVTRILGSTTRANLPREPAKTPRDYQLSAVELLRATGRLLLTDEVGLGKTLTGLLNAVHDDALPMIVIPPTHLPRRWETEISEAFPFLTSGVAKKGTPPPNFTTADLPDVFIVPYRRLAGWAPHLQDVAKTVVFDEVQDVRRGVETVKGTAAAAVCANASYRLGLTATPIYNYGGEIWNILDILAPGELGTKDEFTREWGSWQYNGHISVANPAALGDYLREQGLMLGRTRKEVGRELPDAIKVPHIVNSDPAALDAIKGDATEMAKLILSDTSTRQERWQAAGELDWKMREATGIGKAPYVAEFCRMILESENKIVLFGWHRAVYDIWLEALKEFSPVMYTGTESTAQKAKAEDEFINGRARVLIMSLRSGAGVDGLQKVSNVAVFGELDWSPQVHTQAIGRLRRDGMDTDPVVAYFLNSAEGSDPAVMETLGIKRQQAEPLLSKDGKVLGGSRQDHSRARTLAQQLLGTTAQPTTEGM